MVTADGSLPEGPLPYAAVRRLADGAEEVLEHAAVASTVRRLPLRRSFSARNA
jgi:hypothetical protein